MNQKWELLTLGDVCVSATSSISQNSLANEDGQYPIYGASGLIKNVSFYHRDKPYLSIVKDGSGFGRITKMAAYSSVIGTLQYILPKENVDLDYLYYSLLSIDFTKYVSGAAIPHIYFKDYKKEPFLWMPLSEQKRIVSILDECFTAIDQAKANTERNLKNVRELFESYLQGVFETEGERWEEIALGKLCKLTRGHNPPKSKFISEPKEGYVRFYQIRDGWADDYMVYVPDIPQLHKVNPDDILMVAYRHIGKVFRGVSGAFNVALCKISNVRRDLLNDDFLFYLIPTNFIKGELMKRSERSLIPSMSIKHLKEIIIPLPPLKTQQNIVQRLDFIQAETNKLEAIYQQKLNDFEELKKSILQQAFEGKLTNDRAMTI
jgi:type I restriction enzyme, S subunit